MLSPRLAKIAEKIPRGSRVADVGTDHAHLPVFLVKEGIAASAVATDIKEKPLALARGNIAAAGAEGIRTVLCDGLSAVSSDEADTVVIAGMGGDSMIHIIESAPWLYNPEKLLILQSMSSSEELRRFLARSGFEITEESCVRDSGRLYSVMSVRYCAVCRELSLYEATVGKITPTDEVSRQMLTSLHEVLLKRAEGIRLRPDMSKTLDELLDAAEAIKGALEQNAI